VCSNINTHKEFLEKIVRDVGRDVDEIISGHIVPRIYDSLAKKFDLTREHVFVQHVSMSSIVSPRGFHSKNRQIQINQAINYSITQYRIGSKTLYTVVRGRGIRILQSIWV